MLNKWILLLFYSSKPLSISFNILIFDISTFDVIINILVDICINNKSLFSIFLVDYFSFKVVW